MTPTESRMRAAAMALPVSDFGSHRAIQAAAAVADAMVAERETQMLLAMDSLPDAAEVKRLRLVLEVACGHMMNARIDLETGRTKAAAAKTLKEGIAIVDAALKAARAQSKQAEGGA